IDGYLYQPVKATFSYGEKDSESDRDKSEDKQSDNTDEMSHVLGSLVAADILASGGLRSAFSIASLSVFSPAVATANGSFPTALARDLEAKFAQDDQIIREQAERDSKIVRIHAERELVMMIAKLDKSNEMITKYLSEYEQAKLESERLKRPGIQMDKERSKKLKTTEASGTKPTQENQSKEPKELSEEEIKKMIELEIHTLSILKMKAAYYPDVGLEQMVPDQMWTDEECKYDITAMIERYQTQLNLTKPRWDATGFEYKDDYTIINSPRAITFQDKYEVQMIMRFNEIHKFSDDTLLQIDEALDYRVKEFKKWLKTRRIYRNLESFVGGQVRDGDYRLLKHTE
nr:hypothetical protein [Tanacetum cinerariifolium]